jgi:cell division protein FtsL
MTDIFGDTTRAELQQEIKRLRADLAQRTAERDAARREVCELLATISQTTSRPTKPLNISNWRGWDCFEKEGQP